MNGEPKRALVGAIQKFSTEDGPGIRTTVFLKGCPLRCAWCHNPELIDPRQEIIRMPNHCIRCGYCLTHCPQNAIFLDDEHKIDLDRTRCDLCMQCTSFCYAQSLQAVARLLTAQQVMDEAVQDKGFYDETGGGITVSGGELLAHADFVEELVDLAADAGIHSCLDTSGFGDSGALLRLARRESVTDILYDMKSIDDTVHIRYTGQSNALILENLKRLAGDSAVHDKLQMRMPLVRGVNDTPAIIEATAALFRRLGLRRVTLLPYHNLGVVKSRNIGGTATSFQPPSNARVAEIQAYFETHAGMHVEILGKVGS